MKDFNLLVWITQLGLSIALPLAGFLFLGFWLHRSCQWGSWTVWAGALLGVCSAVGGFRSCIRAMQQLSKSREEPSDPPVAFNDHI